MNKSMQNGFLMLEIDKLTNTEYFPFEKRCLHLLGALGTSFWAGNRKSRHQNFTIL